MDRREAADRRTVKELADREELFIDCRGRDVEVLLNAGQVGEANIKELDVVVLDVLEHFGRITEHLKNSN